MILGCGHAAIPGCWWLQAWHSHVKNPGIHSVRSGSILLKSFPGGKSGDDFSGQRLAVAKTAAFSS